MDVQKVKQALTTFKTVVSQEMETAFKARDIKSAKVLDGLETGLARLEERLEKRLAAKPKKDKKKAEKK